MLQHCGLATLNDPGIMTSLPRSDNDAWQTYVDFPAVVSLPLLTKLVRSPDGGIHSTLPPQNSSKSSEHSSQPNLKTDEDNKIALKHFLRIHRI